MSKNTLPRPAFELFALLRGDNPNIEDWDTLSVYALATGLGPLVLYHDAGRLPALVAARLKLAATRTRHRNLEIMVSLAELLSVAQEQNLELIVLKGAHFAPAIYPDISLRGMSDIDFLVKSHDLASLRLALEGMGYEGKFTSGDSGPGIVKHEWTFQRSVAPSDPANPYLSQSGMVHLEPHTSLAESWFGLYVDITPGVWDRQIVWSLGELPARTLSPTDTLLHTAVHVIFHAIMGKPALVQLFDIKQLLLEQNAISYDLLRKQAIETGAVAYLLAALQLARAAYAAPVPVQWVEGLARVCPPRQRRVAQTLSLEKFWTLTQQPALHSLTQRLIRGLKDRRIAASWARDSHEQWRVWRSMLLFHRTDTAALMRRHLIPSHS